MAYTPTEWETGDVITAEKLNNIEDGIVANEEAIADCVSEIPASAEQYLLSNKGELAVANNIKGAYVFNRLQDFHYPFEETDEPHFFTANMLAEVFTLKNGMLTISADMQSGTFSLQTGDTLPSMDDVLKSTQIMLYANVMLGTTPMGVFLFHLDMANPSGCVFSTIVANTTMSLFAIITIEMPFNTDTGVVTIKHIT